MITEEETTTASSPAFYKSDLTQPRVHLRKLHFPQMGPLPSHLNSSRMNSGLSSLVDVSVSGAIILN